MQPPDATLVHRALGDRSRVRVLRALRGADGALAVPELAAAVGLHENTVRSHLAVLERAGLVTHAVEHRHARGRPRALYASAHRPAADDTAAPLLELLDGLGFEPELAEGERATELQMHRCPFGITPDTPSPQVCRAHLGVLRGALDGLRTPLRLGRLRIFPTPAYCSVELRPAAGPRETP